uniref:Uncharacterized protein n=1 Tax=Arundo donax TaxID=35708 RepID=A0A0A9H3P6_ARUDO
MSLVELLVCRWSHTKSI